jgi:hypothetical protein
VRGDGIGEGFDLGAVQEQHLSLDPLGQPHPGRRVPCQPAAFDRCGEDLAEDLVGVADPGRRQATLD